MTTTSTGAKSVRTAAAPGMARYFRLVRKFPLVPIRDDDHLKEAQAVIDRLLTVRLDAGEEQYLDTLTTLVSAYEDEYHPIPAVPPHDLLAFLLASNGRSQADLVRATGIAKATVSDVLSGKRALTVDQMHAVGRYFGLPATAFLPPA